MGRKSNQISREKAQNDQKIIKAFVFFVPLCG